MPEELRYGAPFNQSAHDNASEGAPKRSLVPYKEYLLRLGSAAAQERGWRAVLTSIALVSLITIGALWAAPIIGAPNLIIVYVLAVVFSALRWGRRAAVFSAISSAFLLDYFFIPPYRSFVSTDLWYLITLIGLLALGLLVSLLLSAAQKEAQEARTREAYTAALYSLTASLADANHLDQILEVVARRMIETFQRPIVILLPGAEGLVTRFRSPEFASDESESAAAVWVSKNGEDAGTGTGMFPDSKTRYLPLKTWRGVVGVLGFQPNSLKEWLPDSRRQLLGAFMNQAALALTRTLLAEDAQRAQLLQETDRLQKALLNSISHDLRTPLASVTGALDSVLGDWEVLDARTQRELLETARSEARRLNQLVQNLLDMTRLEGGAVHLNTERCDIQDVIGTALGQLGEVARHRQITVDLAPDLPLVLMDFVLIVQVMVNLLDNALKYSEGATPVQVEAQVAEGQLQVRISDHGKGIRDDDLERVFDKFYRGTSAGAPGAGLGLSICKGLVEAHGGRIWVERRPEGGIVAAFTLPSGEGR